MKKLLFIAIAFVAFSNASFAINPKLEINLVAKEIQTKIEKVEVSKEDEDWEFCYEIGRTTEEVFPDFYEVTVYYHCTTYSNTLR